MKERYSIILSAVFIGMLLIPYSVAGFDTATVEELFYPRTQLVNLTSDMRLLLGDRVFSKVLVGDNNWLVYTGEGDLQDYQKLDAFTAEELLQLQVDLDALSATYTERGITLLIVIVPSKSTIYPERVPDQIPVIGSRSRLEQVMSSLRPSGTTLLPDMRPALNSAKTERDIYYATDTHWNDYGAYVGYTVIMNELQKTYPELAPHPMLDFEVMELGPESLDLSAIMGTALLTESKVNFVPLYHPQTSYKNINVEGCNLTFSHNPDKSLPDLVIYYDSFFFNVNTMLGEHFHNGVFVQHFTRGGLWNLSWVDEQSPDVVIIEFNERYLGHLLNFISQEKSALH
jgi:hypothetical protein